MPLYSEIKACRSCGSTQLAEALDLGSFFLSDFQDSPEGFTDAAPLALVRCQECTLVQLRHTVDRDRLYQQYWYRSGTNESMVRALRDVVDDAMRRVTLQPSDVVLDIGANDGTLLRNYPEYVRCWGVEPSPTFSWPGAWYASRTGNIWSSTYWPCPEWVGPYGPAKIITSIACFYDTTIPNEFVRAIKKHLAPDGVWINQLAYLPDTLKTNNFGDICHEHLSYWSCWSFRELLNRHGLAIESVSFNDVNGGSVRFVVRHADQVAEHALIADRTPLIDLKRFAQRVRLQRSEVRDFLHRSMRDGKPVVGYGASTKGNTYLQYWGIGPNLLPWIADRNPDKWGKYVPTGQRVISEEEMRAAKPDYLLILPFHFLDAFAERERAYLESGGKFVVPFPSLRTIGGDDASYQQTTPAAASRPAEAA